MRAWSYAFNTVVADRTSVKNMSAWIVWSIKEIFKTAGYVIAGSCDGVAAGLDGVDRWGAVFDTTKIVRSATVARSWVTLTKATLYGDISITLECSGSSDAAFVKTRISRGALSGGSTTASPTGAADTSWGAPTAVHDSSLAAHRIHAIYNADGDVLVFTTKTGTVNMNLAAGVFVIDQAAVGMSGYQYPFTSVIVYNTNNVFTGTSPHLSTPCFWNSSYWNGFSTVGASESSKIVIPLAGSSFLGGGGSVGGSSVDSKYRVVPVYVTLDNFDVSGALADMYISLNNMSGVSLVFNESNVIEHAFVGLLQIPCNTFIYS